MFQNLASSVWSGARKLTQAHGWWMVDVLLRFAALGNMAVGEEYADLTSRMA